MRLFNKHFEMEYYLTNLHNRQLFTHEKMKNALTSLQETHYSQSVSREKSKEHYMLVRSATSIGCNDKRWHNRESTSLATTLFPVRINE